MGIGVEPLGVPGAFAEIFDEGFEVFWFHIAGDGLWGLAGDDDDGGGKFELAVGEPEGEFIDAVLRIIVVSVALPVDGGMAFGVDPDGIEFIVEVFGDGFVGVGFFIHLFTPAAPGGVEIDENGFLFLLEFAGSFVDGNPGNGGFGGRIGLFGSRKDHQQEGRQGDGE